MANEQPLDKPAVTDRKPARNQARQPQQPQVRSPLLNDGPELERDSHC